ncbi:MAG: amidohydrolase family protein, partial [Firmicutes bacterium]|nr:amidohydrolase family protein [Bacillota bacterium]
CKAANRAGLQIEMHAIGDRAFDQACKGIKAALDDYPREDHRHGIIHACLTTEWGRHVCMDYKIQLPMQVAFDNWAQEPAEYIEEILGKERAALLNPARTFTDLGCVVSFSSDGPCTAPDPVVWIDKAVNYSNPALRMTVQEALRMSTYNGYWTTFDEKERGSLEAGKIADMAVLSANPYEIAPEELKDLKVEQTILGGKPYAKQKGGFVPTVLKGILGSGSF